MRYGHTMYLEQNFSEIKYIHDRVPCLPTAPFIRSTRPTSIYLPSEHPVLTWVPAVRLPPRCVKRYCAQRRVQNFPQQTPSIPTSRLTRHVGFAFHIMNIPN